MLPASHEVARQYLYGGLAWGTLAEFWMLGVLGALFFSGFSWRLAARLKQRTLPFSAALLGLVVAALAPFDFYLDFVRERAYGFADQTAAGWWADWLKSAGLTILVGALVTTLAYAALRHGGPARHWWIRLWALTVAVVILAVAAEPVLIAPLFNHFTPVADVAVREAIGREARRAGIPHAEILEVDASRQSGHTNAYVVGLLGSQRIVLYDTLLERQPLDEVEFVAGHEIGHYALHHLWKGVGFAAALLWVAFWLTSRLFARWAPRGGVHRYRDPAGLPLLLLILAGLVWLGSPLANGFSRWEEHQADAYGLRLTGDGCAAARSFEREVATDLEYPNPPGWVVWWFFNHPSPQQRIDYALRFCRETPWLE